MTDQTKPVAKILLYPDSSVDIEIPVEKERPWPASPTMSPALVNAIATAAEAAEEVWTGSDE